jgi:hypothetical protein
MGGSGSPRASAPTRQLLTWRSPGDPCGRSPGDPYGRSPGDPYGALRRRSARRPSGPTSSSAIAAASGSAERGWGASG